MKKIILSGAILSLIAGFTVAHAETMQGKMTMHKNNMVQVQDENGMTKNLKTGENTHYFSKKKVSDPMMMHNNNNQDIMVEIIYSYDTQTGDMIIDELTWMED